MPTSRTRSPKFFFFGLLILALVVGLFALMTRPQENTDGKFSDKKGGRQKEMSVLVTVAPVKTEDIPITVTAIGNVEALETVSIQPQIGGQLRKVFFKQGDFVQKGQLLFEIDPRLQSEAVQQAQATLNSSQSAVQQGQANVAKSAAAITMAQANLQRDQAQLTLAKLQEERYRNLLAKSYVTREQYDQMNSALQTAQATIASDQAAIENAKAQQMADRQAVQTSRSSVAGNRAVVGGNQIQLGFTKIKAPVAGKTGALLVNAGNIVQPNSTTLVSIARLQPILVAFSIPEKYLLPVQQAMYKEKVPVEASLSDQKNTVAKESAAISSGKEMASKKTTPQDPAETGRLIFVDNAVDVTSGTVRLKAQFENKKQILWPGRFVDVVIRLGIQRGALVVPAVAVQKGQQGDFVYVVQSGKAQVRLVQVERISGDQAIIASGLKVNEQVVTDGQMRLAPDARVKISGQQKGNRKAATDEAASKDSPKESP